MFAHKNEKKRSKVGDAIPPSPQKIIPPRRNIISDYDRTPDLPKFVNTPEARKNYLRKTVDWSDI